jgi:GTPase SAR1 family protein
MTQAVSDRASEYMAAWYARRPSFALMGEYSSGKSALLNALLGKPLLPTRVTATDLPAVWITKGSALRLAGLGYDGTLTDLEPEDLNSERAMQFLCVRVESDAAILAKTDIIDTPGISDPRMTTLIVEEIARYIDFAIWCSPLNQAWRQTERAFWKRIPEATKTVSIMALTRADLMRGRSDIAKVVRRCSDETKGSFAAVLPVSAPLAEASRAALTELDRAQHWVDSGFPALLQQLDSSMSAAEATWLSRPRPKEPAVPDQAPPATKSKKKQPRAQQEGTLVLARVAQDMESTAQVVSIISTLRAAVKDFPTNNQELDTIGHLSNAVTLDTSLGAEHRDVLCRVLTISGETQGSLSRVLMQVENEIEDFAEGPWCDLGTERFAGQT